MHGLVIWLILALAELLHGTRTVELVLYSEPDLLQYSHGPYLETEPRPSVRSRSLLLGNISF